jgi:hypothetical protein
VISIDSESRELARQIVAESRWSTANGRDA